MTPKKYAKIFPDADPIMDLGGDEEEVIIRVAERLMKTPEEVREILKEASS